MFRYTSKKEPKTEAFKSPSEGFWDSGNWLVQLAALLPWDSLAEVYGKTMSGEMGAPGVDARIVIGAVIIIKHKMKLDDRGTIGLIRETPYIQYFLGLDKGTAFNKNLGSNIANRSDNVTF